jgi:hypothetical protein
MQLIRCPRCGIPVLFLKVTADREIAIEPQIDVDIDSPDGMRWIPHSEDRCAFAGLIDADFG